MRRDRTYPCRHIWFLLVLLAVLAAVVTAGLACGSASFSLRQLAGGFLRESGYETEAIILYKLRLPRVAAGMLAGVGLSVAGVLLQAMTNNALASPNVIGVNAGAGFCVILCLCFFPSAFAVLPLAAYSIIFQFTSTQTIRLLDPDSGRATLFIVTVSGRAKAPRITLLLAGIACNALLNAGISFLSLLYPDVLASYSHFSVGGFSGVALEELAVPAVLIAGCLLAALAAAGKANLLCLGDSMAASLGVRVKALRIFCLLLASASAAAVVSFAGLLGFVGLVVPHIARRLVGTELKWLLAASALLGASLTVLSDLVGRALFAPSELPVGIVMACIGAPFFFVLLLRIVLFDFFGRASFRRLSGKARIKGCRLCGAAAQNHGIAWAQRLRQIDAACLRQPAGRVYRKNRLL